MKRKQIPVNLHVELLEAIENMAKIQKRTRSNMIETLLGNAIAEKRVEYRETRKLESLDRIERTRDTRHAPAQVSQGVSASRRDAVRPGINK